jgi:hypothetical protein
MGWKRAIGFSPNKGPSFSLWRLSVLVLYRSTGRSPASSSAKPPRWWSGKGIKAGVVFFNKRWLLWCSRCVQQPFSPLTGHGGSERGGMLMATCSGRGGREEHEDELINANSFSAYYRHGGGFSTSREEAMLRSGHGSSRPIHHEVMHSPWRIGGPWLRFIAERGLSGYRPLLLGGDASRTPARGGGGAQGLDCNLTFGSRVLFVKRSALSLDRRSPRARIIKVVSEYCT